MGAGAVEEGEAAEEGAEEVVAMKAKVLRPIAVEARDVGEVAAENPRTEPTALVPINKLATLSPLHQQLHLIFVMRQVISPVD